MDVTKVGARLQHGGDVSSRKRGWPGSELTACRARDAFVPIFFVSRVPNKP